MSSKSLPAHLQQVLEHHVSQSDLVDDDELKGIMERLTKLNESVEKIKLVIKKKREQKSDLER